MSKYPPHPRRRVVAAFAVTASLIIAVAAAAIPAASAAQPVINLATAGSFGVLAASTVTNTGPSVVSGNVGVYAGTAITGFATSPSPGPGTIINGTLHSADGVAEQAQSDNTTAYGQAAGAASTASVTGVSLGATGPVGMTLTQGVYTSTNDINVNGLLILSGNANSVFVFQAADALYAGQTDPTSIELTGGVQACNVFWQVGSSATLFTGTSLFSGSVLALASVTVDSGVAVAGSLLAQTGQVSLIDDTVTASSCGATMTTAPSSTSTSLGNSVNDVATVTGTSSAGVPTGSVQFYQCGPGSTSCAPGAGTAMAPASTLVGGVATSPNITPGAVGTYCFAAVYLPTGTAYATTSETGTTLNGECFVITNGGTPPTTTPAPTVTTTAPSSTSITLGESIDDIATVTGNAADGTPTGGVQFYQCGPPSTACSSSSGTALSTATPLAGGVATSPSFTPTAAGTYCFAAVYIPSAGSVYAASSEAGTSTDGECFVVTVAGVTPPATPAITISTSASSSTAVTLGGSVHDVVTVTGNATDGIPTGTVEFYQCGPASILCSSVTGVALSPSEALVDGVATGPAFTPTAVGTYCFASVYTPTGAVYATSSEAGSAANGECFTVSAHAVPPAKFIPTTKSAPSKGSITLGQSVSDVATLTGTSADGPPTGSLQFYECGPGTGSCSPASGTALNPSATLSGGKATSPSFKPTATGTYCFASVYSPASGSAYAKASEVGNKADGECITVTAAVKPVTPRKPPGTVVPPFHTGEPWAALSYWLDVAALGFLGLGLVAAGRPLRRTRRHAKS